MVTPEMTVSRGRWLDNCPLAGWLLANAYTHNSCEPSILVAANMYRIRVDVQASLK